MTVEELKTKGKGISRQDICDLLSSIGKPGEKQDEKIKAVKELGLTNQQGIGVEVTLHSYAEF